jgi:hypothetical protein
MVHRGKTAQMWNKAFNEHKNYNPTCEGQLDWDPNKELQRGLCWQETIVWPKASHSKPDNTHSFVPDTTAH